MVFRVPQSGWTKSRIEKKRKEKVAQDSQPIHRQRYRTVKANGMEEKEEERTKQYGMLMGAFV